MTFHSKMIENEDPVIAGSLWTATAHRGTHFPALQGSETADVCVVGAGFTGLSAALHLALSGQRVVVVDAQTPGWGASGRNGGQVNPGLIENPDVISEHYGRIQGHKAVQASGNAGQRVFDLIKDHGISCDAKPVGWVQAAHSAQGAAVLADKLSAWARVGVGLDRLDGPELHALMGSNAYVAGIRDPRGGNLHPLNYALGLADAAAAAGALIFAHSPVVSMDADGVAVTLTTAQGSIAAGKVLICTNGYSGTWMPKVAQSVIPVRSVQVATAPLGDTLAGSILPGGHAVSDTRSLLLYFRKGPDGRFIMGGRGAYGARGTQAAMDDLRSVSVEVFPQLAGQTWDFAWGGYIAATPDHFPRLMEVAPNVIAGLGYNGRGVAMATEMGVQLARWAGGDVDLDFPITGPHRIALHGLAKWGVTFEVVRRKLLDKLGR
ncbi:MAG: FAD-binding oxidoreductase [Pseudomonadota bacterium]